MKRNATILELLISLFGELGVIIAAWVNINSRLAILETQQKNDHDQMIEIRADLKEIKANSTSILLQLQTKKDK